MFDTIFPKLHKEGYRFIVIAAIVTFVAVLISTFIGAISFILTVWIYYFFRDPKRYPIQNDGYLVSPADGIISQIVDTNGPKELGLDKEQYTRVSIFMNVFNCHVNRVPASGTINKIFYKPGRYINASLDKASEENERNYIELKTNTGEKIILVQIAGLIARRIVCEVSEDDAISQGNKFGIIRFGSRVDLYFKNFELMVKKNQSTIAGETIIAKKN